MRRRHRGAGQEQYLVTSIIRRAIGGVVDIRPGAENIGTGCRNVRLHHIRRKLVRPSGTRWCKPTRDLRVHESLGTRQPALLTAAGRQPVAQPISIGIANVRGRQAVLVGNGRFALCVGVRQDHARRTGQLDVLPLFNAAVLAPIANHDLTVERVL